MSLTHNDLRVGQVQVSVLCGRAPRVQLALELREEDLRCFRTHTKLAFLLHNILRLNLLAPQQLQTERISNQRAKLLYQIGSQRRVPMPRLVKEALIRVESYHVQVRSHAVVEQRVAQAQ